MENLGISLGDYSVSKGLDASAQGQADLSSDQLNDLKKALEAGHQLGSDQSGNQSTGGALKVESLERTLKVITFKESDIRFWKRFPKTPAFNTVEEYNQLTSFGNDRGGFNNEGELPEEEDTTFKRKSELVKYLGTTRVVTHQMNLVRNAHGNAYQQQVDGGIKWILRKADQALFWGDSAIISQEWNGLYAQHMNNEAFGSLEEYCSSDVVIDLRGNQLTETNIEDGSQVIMRQFGHADLLVAPPVVCSDFSTGFYARKRIAAGTPAVSAGQHVAGQYINKFDSMFGIIDIDYDIFASKPNSSGKKLGASASHPKAPSAPTAAGSPTTVLTDGLTKFGDSAGSYFYMVTAINRYGESAPTQLGGTVVVTGTEAVDLDFTATAGTYSAAAFVIYRSKVDPAGTASQTTFYPILTVPATGSDAKRGSLANGVDGASAGNVRDRNRFLPGTEEALLIETTDQVINFKQLAPIMKMDLARLSPAERFMVLLYGTPFLYAPSKMVRYINIGRKAVV